MVCRDTGLLLRHELSGFVCHRLLRVVRRARPMRCIPSEPRSVQQNEGEYLDPLKPLTRNSKGSVQ